MQHRLELGSAIVLRALALLLAATGLACAPKMPPPVDAGPPSGYDRLESSGAFQPGFEQPPAPLDPADVLPIELLHGPHHAVRAVRVDEDFLYVFDVECEYGHLEVAGRAMLRKRVHELEALAALRAEQPGTARLYAYEVANSALEPVEGTLQVLRHPVRTVTNVPRGAWSSARAYWEMKELGRTYLEDDYMDEFSGLAGQRREWAVAMGVDPYTTNPYVRQHLRRNSWISLAGRTTVQIATFAVPGGAASIALSAVGTSNTMTDAVRDVAPEDVRVTTRDWLGEVLDVDEASATAFLEHPWYTPTRQEILIRALGRLDGVSHRDEFIRLASRADEPRETHAFARLALMLAEYHERVAPLEELFVTRELVLARTRDGRVVLPLYMDLGYWTESMAQAELELVQLLEQDGVAGPRELLVSGGLTTLARQQIEARGWSVTEGVEEQWLPAPSEAARTVVASPDRRILPELGK